MPGHVPHPPSPETVVVARLIAVVIAPGGQEATVPFPGYLVRGLVGDEVVGADESYMDLSGWSTGVVVEVCRRLDLVLCGGLSSTRQARISLLCRPSAEQEHRIEYPLGGIDSYLLPQLLRLLLVAPASLRGQDMGAPRCYWGMHRGACERILGGLFQVKPLRQHPRTTTEPQAARLVCRGLRQGKPRIADLLLGLDPRRRSTIWIGRACLPNLLTWTSHFSLLLVTFGLMSGTIDYVSGSRDDNRSGPRWYGDRWR